MYKFRYLVLIFLLLACPRILNAQDNGFALRLRTGHNTSFGGFAAVSMEAVHDLDFNLRLSAGAQYNSIGKTSAEVRPEYQFDVSWGKLSAESMISYTHLTSVNSIAAGAGIGLYGKRVGGRLGYYYRLYGGSGGWIKEAFNIYYEIHAEILPEIDRWDLQMIITNCEMFELERHFQPSFILQGCCYPRTHLGISFGVGCKPAGIFNISADYYQSYIKTGVCYRW